MNSKTHICSLCGNVVLEEQSIKLMTEQGDDVFMHWECVMTFRKPEEKEATV